MLPPAPPTVLVGGRLLDGRSPDAIAGGVLVTDERGIIVAAGRAAAVARDGAMRIDAGGLTILPGIIDCHVHLSLRLEPVADQAQRSATDLVVRALGTGRDFLEAGVTTVRDAGYTPTGIKRAFASGAFPGPRTQVSCTSLRPAATATAGPHPASRSRPWFPTCRPASPTAWTRCAAPHAFRFGPVPIGSK